jgi:hypothetical protein
MPIPTYSVIADSEIDPESPITTSLMFRLRDNVLAILGIDPATPSPVFTIPPSTLEAVGPDCMFDQGYGATVTTNEVVVSVIADDVEWVELMQDVVTVGPTGDVLAHLGYHNNTPLIIVGWNLQLIDVIYASGAPTGVRIMASRISITAAVGSPTRTSYDVTITLANTFQTVISGVLTAKARATATDVYLQLRLVDGGLQSWISVPFNRRSFKSKQ